jgi:hypothetical protein
MLQENHIHLFIQVFSYFTIDHFKVTFLHYFRVGTIGVRHFSTTLFNMEVSHKRNFVTDDCSSRISLHTESEIHEHTIMIIAVCTSGVQKRLRLMEYTEHSIKVPENWRTSRCSRCCFFAAKRAPASFAVARWTIVYAVCAARLIKLSKVQFCISLFFDDFMKAGVCPLVWETVYIRVNSQSSTCKPASALPCTSIGDDGGDKVCRRFEISPSLFDGSFIYHRESMNLDKTARRWDKSCTSRGKEWVCENGDFTAILICNYALKKSERGALLVHGFFYRYQNQLECYLEKKTQMAFRKVINLQYGHLHRQTFCAIFQI